MLKKYTVTYSGSNPREAIQGLGLFERDARRDVLLTDAQAAGLRRKGFEVLEPIALSPPIATGTVKSVRPAPASSRRRKE